MSSFSKETRTPKFGRCTSNGATGRCVLTAEDCRDGETYVKPSSAATTSCSAFDVTIGRCGSTLEQGRCASTPDTCTYPKQFVSSASNNECNLVTGEGHEGLTLYSACENFQDGFSRRCVLGFDECIENESPISAEGLLAWSAPCFCGAVPTGVCYAGARPDASSYCAVSASDCLSGTEEFMSANDFDSLDDAPFTCRLCDRKQDTYKAGACKDSSGRLTQCVMESTDCDSSSETYVNSVNLLKDYGVICDAEFIPSYGECTSEVLDKHVQCTNKATSCRSAQNFVRKSTCGLYADAVREYPTFFGHCTPHSGVRDWKDDRCVWDATECHPTEEYFVSATAPSSFQRNCQCEHVKVGACEHSLGQYHCAVSPNACENPSTYIPNRNFESKQITLECALCAPRLGQKASNQAAPPIVYKNQPLQSSRSVDFPSSSSLSTGATAGIIIAVVSCVIAVFAIGVRRFRKRKEEVTNDNTKSVVAEEGGDAGVASTVTPSPPQEVVVADGEFVRNEEGFFQ